MNPKLTKALAHLLFCAIVFISCSQPKQTEDASFFETESIGIQKEAILNDFRLIRSTAPIAQLADSSMEMLSSLAVFQDFRNPPERMSVNGKLDTEIKVTYEDQVIYNTKKKANLTVKLRNYEGGLVGPTIRLTPGDLMRVNLVNDLPSMEPNPGPCNPTTPMHHAHNSCDQIDSTVFNTTNLHTHGLHVSPSGVSDNVLLQIKPSCSFQHEYNLPASHPQGIFWYHGHVHGSTAVQVSSGMGGALIVSGGLDAVPEIKNAEEKIFVFQQIPYTETAGEFGVENFDASFGPQTWKQGVRDLGWRTMINGQTFPVIRMKSGEVQRWRFIHAGVRETINVNLERHEFNQIAQDGIAMGYMQKTAMIELQPGYRSDVLIKANVVTTTDTLVLFDDESSAVDGLQAQSESPKVLAVVVITPELKDMPLPSDDQLKSFPPFKPIEDSEVANNPVQKLEFNINTSVTPICFTINGQPFNMNNPPRVLTLDQPNEWELTSLLANHPYHIHVNSFQVMRIQKKDGSQQVFNPPLWKDTYLVKNGDKVVIRSRYEDFTGDFVLHCHILDHEDQGMMELVRIVGPL